jgi:hypothetical protein
MKKDVSGEVAVTAVRVVPRFSQSEFRLMMSMRFESC